MARKTKLMRTVEERFNRPLERLLPEMVNERGLTDTAVALGISNSVLGYWLLKLGTLHPVHDPPGSLCRKTLIEAVNQHPCS